MATQAVRGLLVNIDGKVDGLVRAVNNAENRIGGFVKNTQKLVGGLAAAIGAANVAGAFSRWTAEGDKFAKTAAKLGTSAETIQQLGFAAERSGVNVETLINSMQGASRKISEAAMGAGDAAKVLQELGLSAKSLSTLSVEEQMFRIADAMGGVTNQSDKVRIAMKLFEAEGVSLINLMSGGAEGIRALTKEAESLGGVMSNELAAQSEVFQDRLTNLGEEFKETRNIILDLFLPAAIKVVEWTSILVDGFNSLLRGIGWVVKGFGAAAASIAAAVTGDFGLAKGVIQAFIDDFNSVPDKLKDAATKSGEISVEELTRPMTALQEAIESDTLIEAYADMYNALDEDFNEWLRNRESAYIAHKTFMLNQTAALIGSLGDLITNGGQKNFKAYQAFQIAETLISTYSAAQATMEAHAKQAALFGDTTAIARGYAHAAAITAAGLARVQAIASAKPGSSAGSGSAGSSAGFSGSDAAQPRQQNITIGGGLSENSILTGRAIVDLLREVQGDDVRIQFA